MTWRVNVFCLILTSSKDRGKYREDFPSLRIARFETFLTRTHNYLGKPCCTIRSQGILYAGTSVAARRPARVSIDKRYGRGRSAIYFYRSTKKRERERERLRKVINEPAMSVEPLRDTMRCTKGRKESRWETRTVVIETADHRHVLLARGCFISYALVNVRSVKLIYRRKSSQREFASCPAVESSNFWGKFVENLLASDHYLPD